MPGPEGISSLIQFTPTTTTAPADDSAGVDSAATSGASPSATADVAPAVADERPSSAQLLAAQQRLHTLADSTIRFSSERMETSSMESILRPDTKLGFRAGRAHERVIAGIADVAQKMAGLDKMLLEDFKNFGDVAPKVETAVDLAVKAQYKLKADLETYGKRSGVDVSEQLRMCDRKVAEILNFVGTAMMSKIGENPKELPASFKELSATDNIRQISLDMHGTRFVSKELMSELESIYSSLEILESQTDIMTEDVFMQKMGNLKIQLTTAESKLEAFRATGDAQAREGVAQIHYDQTAVSAITTAISCAKTRLEGLENTSSRGVFASMVEGLQKSYTAPTELISQLETSSIPPLFHIHPLSSDTKPPIVTLQESVEAVFTALQTNPLNPTDISNAIGNFNFTRIEHENDLRNLGDAIYHLLNPSDSSNTAAVDMLVYDLNRALGTPLNDDTRLQLEQLQGLCDATLVMEFERIQSLIGNIQEGAHRTGEYIHTAFSGPANINTLIELKIRNFAPTSVALDAVDDKPVVTKKLGQGAANQVFLCTYQLDTGETVQYVFKGEHDARRGLANLAAGQLGYARGIYVNQVNVQAHRVAEQFGCGGVIAKSSVGTLHGQFGLFMEAAPGATMRQLNDTPPKPAVTLPDGRTFSVRELGKVFTTPELKKTFVKNLALELAKLEWADAFSGQVDRHHDNYLLHIDPVTAAVKITGIDNDASYSSAMIGAGKVRLASHGLTQERDFAGTVLTDDEAMDLKGQTGLNQMFRPLFMPQKVFEALQNFNPVTYAQSLQGTMSLEQIQSAVARMTHCADLAQEYQREGLVFTDDMLSSDEFLRKLNDAVVRQKQGLTYLQRNFISRDFPQVTSLIRSALT